MLLERNIVWLSVGDWLDKEVVDSVDDIEQADRISFREACLLHSGCAIKLRHPKRTITTSTPPIDVSIGYEPVLEEKVTTPRLLGRIVGQPWLKKTFTIFWHGSKAKWEFPPCEALLIYCGETAYHDSGFLLYGVRESPLNPTSEELRKLADEHQIIIERLRALADEIDKVPA